MQRREFAKRLLGASIAGPALVQLAACSTDDSASSSKAAACGDELEDLKSFGYYEGLSPEGTRSPNRTDGTYYNMPCIPAEDIRIGEAKDYEFWHGHGGGTHRFNLSEEDFRALASGEEVEIHTNVIDGHRHALRITPAEPCD